MRASRYGLEKVQYDDGQSEGQNERAVNDYFGRGPAGLLTRRAADTWQRGLRGSWRGIRSQTCRGSWSRDARWRQRTFIPRSPGCRSGGKSDRKSAYGPDSRTPAAEAHTNYAGELVDVCLRRRPAVELAGGDGPTAGTAGGTGGISGVVLEQPVADDFARPSSPVGDDRGGYVSGGLAPRDSSQDGIREAGRNPNRAVATVPRLQHRYVMCFRCHTIKRMQCPSRWRRCGMGAHSTCGYYPMKGKTNETG